jgi:hypothetical protein
MDVTVVNITLPHIQDDLGFSHEGLAWVVNGYALKACGFLLPGGRPADMYGRRLAFVAGVLVFGAEHRRTGQRLTQPLSAPSNNAGTHPPDHDHLTWPAFTSLTRSPAGYPAGLRRLTRPARIRHRRGRRSRPRP